MSELYTSTKALAKHTGPQQAACRCRARQSTGNALKALPRRQSENHMADTSHDTVMHSKLGRKGCEGMPVARIQKSEMHTMRPRRLVSFTFRKL